MFALGHYLIVLICKSKLDSLNQTSDSLVSEVKVVEHYYFTQSSVLLLVNCFVRPIERLSFIERLSLFGGTMLH